jgi:hypothetical protein
LSPCPTPVPTRRSPQEALAPLNTLSLTGRALDAGKLAAGAFAVFLLGNYVNFQPWDRDNCKLLNVWLMVASGLSGALLAAPFEALAGWQPGAARLANWTGSSLRTVREGLAASSAPAGKKGASSSSRARPSPAVATVATALAVAAAGAFVLSTTTGALMLVRERAQYHVLLDEDQQDMAAWISTNLAPKANVLHKDVHITPSGTLAGRTALISYNGWMWSHGYNYGDRDRDRQYVLNNALKESEPEAYNTMRRWGVRYVLCEWCTRHARPKEAAYNDAIARKSRGEPGVVIPPFDADMYLDGQLKRIYSRGRYDLLEVQGYGFPPS